MKPYRPSIAEIIEMEQWLTNDIYGEIRTEYEEEERYYNLDFKSDLRLPKEFVDDATILPTARDAVDTFVDYIDISNIKIHTNRSVSAGLSDEDQRLIAQFYYGMVHHTNTRASISPWRIAAKHYALHGVTHIKTIWRADMWPSKPIQKTGESDKEYRARLEEWEGETQYVLPIIISAVHPHAVMTDPTQNDPAYVIESHDYSVFDIKKRYPRLASRLSDKKPEDTCKVIHYWDNFYRCELVDGEPILPGSGVVAHKYGFIPYVTIESGFGNVSADGNIARRYVGILRYIKSILQAESRSYSMSDIIIKKGAWPVTVIEGENADQIANIELKYGTYQPLPPGTKLTQISPEVPPAALRDHFLNTSEIVAGSAAPRSLRGMPESGVRSAADRRQMMEAGSSRYNYSPMAFANGTAKVLINCARLYKNVVPGNVRMSAKSPTDYTGFDEVIDKSKMREPFSCYVEYMPTSAEENYRIHDSLRLRKESGLISTRHALEQQSDIDPDTVEEEMYMEQLDLDPQLAMIRSQYAAGKLVKKLSEKAMLEGEPPMMGGGMPMGGGPPGAGGQPPTGGMVSPIPNRAQPGSVEAIRNKLKAEGRPNATMQGQGGGGKHGIVQ
uniref:Portal protein n=1 Tax=viral metagenome TaxID=1070528 RepID=A0A6H1ZFB0_9ZZZZ